MTGRVPPTKAEGQQMLVCLVDGDNFLLGNSENLDV